MGKRELRAAIKRLLKNTDLTWEETQAILGGLAGGGGRRVPPFPTPSRIVSVTEEMSAAIRGQIVSGVMMESTPFEVMSVITNILGIRDLRGFREIGTTGISAKAEAIMRTELLTVQSAASWTKMADAKNRFPDLEQVWLATYHNRTRWEHIIAHGQRVKEGEPFIMGGGEGRFPRDPSL